jgi:hypothetical protein
MSRELLPPPGAWCRKVMWRLFNRPISQINGVLTAGYRFAIKKLERKRTSLEGTKPAADPAATQTPIPGAASKHGD